MSRWMVRRHRVSGHRYAAGLLMIGYAPQSWLTFQKKQVKL